MAVGVPGCRPEVAKGKEPLVKGMMPLVARDQARVAGFTAAELEELLKSTKVQGRAPGWLGVLKQFERWRRIEIGRRFCQRWSDPGDGE